MMAGLPPFGVGEARERRDAAALDIPDPARCGRRARNPRRESLRPQRGARRTQAGSEPQPAARCRGRCAARPAGMRYPPAGAPWRQAGRPRSPPGTPAAIIVPSPPASFSSAEGAPASTGFALSSVFPSPAMRSCSFTFVSLTPTLSSKLALASLQLQVSASASGCGWGRGGRGEGVFSNYSTRNARMSATEAATPSGAAKPRIH